MKDDRCGFKDIRKDSKGYFCSVCGERMPKNFLLEVAMFSGVEAAKQIERQSK